MRVCEYESTRVRVREYESDNVYACMYVCVHVYQKAKGKAGVYVRGERVCESESV